MTTNSKQINQLLKAIKGTKVRIATERDILRNQADELADILDSLEMSYDGLDTGIQYIQEAIDEASKYL